MLFLLFVAFLIFTLSVKSENTNKTKTKDDEIKIQDIIPRGKYCGRMGSEIIINVEVLSQTNVNLYLSIFGKHFNCRNEPVILHSNRTIDFPSSNIRRDCMYRIFEEFGKENISFSYNNRIDEISVILPMDTIHLRHCNN